MSRNVINMKRKATLETHFRNIGQLPRQNLTIIHINYATYNTDMQHRCCIYLCNSIFQGHN